MILTDEQENILEAAIETRAKGVPMTINAGPGTGKTAILQMIAQAYENNSPRPCKKTIYLAPESVTPGWGQPIADGFCGTIVILAPIGTDRRRVIAVVAADGPA